MCVCCSFGVALSGWMKGNCHFGAISSIHTCDRLFSENRLTGGDWGHVLLATSDGPTTGPVV